MDAKNEKIKLVDKEKIILLCIGFVALAWILDSILDSLIFHEGTIIGQIITPTNHEIAFRLLFGSIFIVFGIYIQSGILRSKNAEHALKVAVIKAEDEKNKTKAIIEAIGDGIILQDTNYKIVYQNQIQNAIYGNRIGEYCYKAYEGKDTLCEDCPIEASFSDRKIHKTERSVSTDKGILYIELTGSPLRDSTGKIIGGVKVVRDITGLKRVEESLWESEEKYRTLFEAAPIGIGIADLEGKVIDCNANMLEMMGLTLEELKSMDVSAIYVDPDERKFLVKTLQETSRVRDREVRLKRKDGTIYHALLSADLLELRGHKVLLTTVRDVTERKRIEEELQKSIHQQTAILNNIPDLAWLKDKESRFIAVNKPFAEACGVRPEDLVGKTDLDIWDKDLAEGYMADDEEVMETGRRKQVEEPLIDKNGRKTWIETIKTPIYDGKDRVIGTTGIARDVTERKQIEEALRTAHGELELRIQERTAELVKTNKTLQAEITERKSAEEALKQSEEKYRKLIDNIQDGVFIIQDAKIQFANEAFARVAGYTVEEVIGKDFRQLVAPEDLEKVVDRYHRRQAGEDLPPEYEFHAMHKDGRTRILINMNVGLITYRGGVATMGTVKDITEKKRFESQLLRAQRMESIGTLASGIAHDINNVLTPIMLSQELLRDRLTDEDSKRLLNTIERSTHRGANLMKQVLSFSKGVEGERNALQVAHFISEIRQIAKETFPRNIEIKTDIPKDLWTISGDATQLHQVIMNLCVNARDAMPDGGILSISAENLLIDEDYAGMNSEAKIGPHIVTTVSDTGTGIPAKIMDRIFEPFFTTKEHGKGTGLGLSTSVGIVRSHGGFINLYSEIGRGSVFKVYLPAITTLETLKVHEHQYKMPAGHGESILVVDDEDQIREITKKILETHGYKVITANDGKKAIALYSQHKEKIKLVLMDMMMPVMDGPSSILEIHKINPEVKVVAVSGLTEKDKLAKVDDAHVQAFLSKPYAAEKLLKTIHEVMSTK